MENGFEKWRESHTQVVRWSLKEAVVALTKVVMWEEER